jgi:hypothetical protein
LSHPRCLQAPRVDSQRAVGCGLPRKVRGTRSRRVCSSLRS